MQRLLMIKPDFTQLEMLSDGEPEFMKEILGMVLQAVPEALQDMEKSLQSEDLHALAKHVHKFKSTVQILSDPELTDYLHHTERICKELGDIQEIEQRISALTKACQEVLPLLEQKLAA